MDKKLEQAILELLESTKKGSIRVTYGKAEQPFTAGQSKFGGHPDVPNDFQWPHYKGADFNEVVENRPLSFLVQINLAEISGLDRENLLPKAGVLSFFYELETMQWGFDPKHRDCAKVFYFPDATALTAKEPPEQLQEDYRLPELEISFKPSINFLPYENFCEGEESEEIFARFPVQDKGIWEEYDDLKKQLGDETNENMDDNSHLLGYPDIIQNAMEWECAAVAQNIYMGSPTGQSLETMAKIREDAEDWVLLFQMGTVEHGNFELMFGDCGNIYFWIKKQDLAAGNFDDIWLILQCY